MTKRRKRVLSQGTVNYLIDDLLHPHMKGKNKKAVVILDGVLHAVNEGNLKKSAKKFVKYSLHKLID